AELWLRGGVRQVDISLWQLGAREVSGVRHEWFFRRGTAVNEAGRTRLAAYRNVIMLSAVPLPPDEREGTASRLCLLELLSLDSSLSVADPAALLRGGERVRFDEHSGALFAGDRLL